MTILRACTQCGRPSTESRCPEHRRAPWQGSTRRSRLPKDWPQRRKFVLADHPTCQLCHNAPSTEVDHINPHGGDDYPNLQGLCTPCHRHKSSREGNQASQGVGDNPQPPPSNRTAGVARCARQDRDRGQGIAPYRP